jgi:hypothetical protein
MPEHHIKVTAHKSHNKCTIDSPDPGTNGKFNHDYYWECDQGDLDIEFNYAEGSPFNSSKFSAPKGRETTKATVLDHGGPGGKAFRYTITVTYDDNTSCKLDPQILIDMDRNWELTQPSRSALGQVVQKLTELHSPFLTAQRDPNGLFFPNGINLISINVQLGAASVTITVAGPQS